MCFFLCLLLNTTKILDVVHEVKRKILKGGRKKADEMGTLEPGSDVVASSLGCLFVLWIPDLELKLLATQKHH